MKARVVLVCALVGAELRAAHAEPRDIPIAAPASLQLDLARLQVALRLELRDVDEALRPREIELRKLSETSLWFVLEMPSGRSVEDVVDLSDATDAERVLALAIVEAVQTNRSAPTAPIVPLPPPVQHEVAPPKFVLGVSAAAGARFFLHDGRGAFEPSATISVQHTTGLRAGASLRYLYTSDTQPVPRNTIALHAFGVGLAAGYRLSLAQLAKVTIGARLDALWATSAVDVTGPLRAGSGSGPLVLATATSELGLRLAGDVALTFAVDAGPTLYNFDLYGLASPRISTRGVSIGLSAGLAWR